jgi:hypothetical protein
VVSSKPRPVYSPEKESLIPIGEKAGWAPEQVWTLWGREKFPVPVGNRTPIIQPVAHRYTTVDDEIPEVKFVRT